MNTSLSLAAMGLVMGISGAQGQPPMPPSTLDDEAARINYYSEVERVYDNLTWPELWQRMEQEKNFPKNEPMDPNLLKK